VILVVLNRGSDGDDVAVTLFMSVSTECRWKTVYRQEGNTFDSFWVVTSCWLLWRLQYPWRCYIERRTWM